MNSLSANLAQSVLAMICFAVSVAPTAARGDGSIHFNGSLYYATGSSKIENLTADVLAGSDDITICAWVYPVDRGENGAGIVAALNAAGSGMWIQTYFTTALAFVANFGGTQDGVWTFPVTFNSWSAIALKYNKSSGGQDPTVRVNFANVTATQLGPDPSGSLPAVNTGYCIGNFSNGSVTWEGRIAHVQIFNRLLSVPSQSFCKSG